MPRKKGFVMDYAHLIREEDYVQARADEYVWQLARGLGVSRRRLFQLLAAGGAATALSRWSNPQVSLAQPAPPPVVKPTPQELFNDFGSNKEMRWEHLYARGYQVPHELFLYVTIREHPWSMRQHGV
jgi:hypothetical protein